MTWITAAVAVKTFDMEANEGRSRIWLVPTDGVMSLSMKGEAVNSPTNFAGETGTIEFDADRAGVFAFYCSEFCSALHLEMTGYLLVEPTGGSAMLSQ